MNIFVLHELPEIAASYHADQHLHKMILESAQMLSTVMHTKNMDIEFLPGFLYKPAYEKHPCTEWATYSLNNTLWLAELALSLESIRTLDLNLAPHASAQICFSVREFIRATFPRFDHSLHTPFVFAGPPSIGIRQSLTITQKYQHYYKRKHRDWLDKGRPMTYKDRPIPTFMQEILANGNN